MSGSFSLLQICVLAVAAPVPIPADKVLGPQDTAVTCLTFSPDGKFVATGGCDADKSGGKVRLWDVATGRLVKTLSGHSGGVQAIAFGVGGKILAAAGDEKVILWDVMEGKQLAVWERKGEYLRNPRFSPNGDVLACECFQGRLLRIRTWDLKKRKEAANSDDFEREYDCPLAFSPDGTKLATAGPKASVRVWDAATLKEIATLEEQSLVLDVVFSPDGKNLLTAVWPDLSFLKGQNVGLGTFIKEMKRQPGSIRSWELSTKSVTTILRLDAGSPSQVAFFPKHNAVIYRVSLSGAKVFVLFPDNDKSVEVFDGSKDGASCIALSPSGAVLGVATDGATVHLLDIEKLLRRKDR